MSRLSRRPRALLATALLCVLGAVIASPAHAGTDKRYWPKINGVLLMNKTDSSRPLDARPGNDPFAGQDARYSCDAVHKRGGCQRRFLHVGGGRHVMTSRAGHNELLGGHGSDTLYAGPWGDVLWGDYKPGGQPTSQRDVLNGGARRDYIYASHGHNVINAGGGNDYIKAHFGRGVIDCGPGRRDRLFISRRAQKGYTITGCERISHKTLGY